MQKKMNKITFKDDVDMKTDRYNKIVLTVIAACMNIIVLGNFGLVDLVKADTPHLTRSGDIAGTYVSNTAADDGPGTSRLNPLYVEVVSLPEPVNVTGSVEVSGSVDVNSIDRPVTVESSYSGLKVYMD